MGQSESYPWIDKLHELRPWNGAGGFGLDGIRAVLKELDDPQDSFKSIHVAGTNGKGSTTAFIAEILNQEGFSVGRMISPHLTKVNERIQVCGVDISDPDLNQLVEKSLTTASKLDLELSFFETVICSGFLYFAELGVDWGVIEVGLGGRLDATNVISKPECTIITSIGLDHQHILGETEGEIAAEKAGIVKEGSPLVLGDLSKEAYQSIAKKAEGKSSDIYRFGKDFSFKHDSDGFFTLRSRYEDMKLRPSLLGEHQGINASVAAFVSKLLGISDEAIRDGLENTDWPSRLEVLEMKGRKFIFDCAHNIQGIQALTSFLNSSNMNSLVLVTGFLGTKEWSQMLADLLPFAKECKLVEPDSQMAISCCDILEEVKSPEKLTSLHYKDYEGLIRELMEESYVGETILITGSIYLVGKLRELILLES